jgi:hypothetical protein
VVVVVGHKTFDGGWVGSATKAQIPKVVALRGWGQLRRRGSVYLCWLEHLRRRRRLERLVEICWR